MWLGKRESVATATYLPLVNEVIGLPDKNRGAASFTPSSRRRPGVRSGAWPTPDDEWFSTAMKTRQRAATAFASG